jgi:hypothetical protein
MPQEGTTTHEHVSLVSLWGRRSSVLEEAGDGATSLRRIEHVSREFPNDFHESERPAHDVLGVAENDCRSSHPGSG